MPAPDYRRATGEPAVPSVTRGLPRWWLWLAFVIAIPVAIRVIAGEHAGAVGETWLYSLLLVPLFLSAAMLGIAAAFPPGTLWGSEGRGYDVLEYHLELPREYAQLNATAPLSHNVYSYLPANMEMLYLLLTQTGKVAFSSPSHLWAVYPS